MQNIVETSFAQQDIAGWKRYEANFKKSNRYKLLCELMGICPEMKYRLLTWPTRALEVLLAHYRRV